MRRLFQRCYKVTESTNTKGENKSGKVIINLSVLEKYIGKKIKVIGYGEQIGLIRIAHCWKKNKQPK